MILILNQFLEKLKMIFFILILKPNITGDFDFDLKSYSYNDLPNTACTVLKVKHCWLAAVIL